MSILAIIIGVIIFFLVGTLMLALIETSGGYMGDSSMVPGCLVVMCLVIVVLLGIGLATGQVGVWFK